MKLADFVKKYSNVQVVDSSTFSLLGEDPQKIRCQVQYWVKQGHLILLKRGVYILSENLRRQPLSMGFIANSLVCPSYLSMEYALSYYDLIPEKTTVYTSITTKKTNLFKTPLGIFEYRSIKEGLFYGFTKRINDGQNCFIAYPEKALLDFFYFSRQEIGADADTEVFESYRFQNVESLNLKRFNELRQKYDKKTNNIGRSFMEFVRLEKKRYKKLK